MAITPRQPQNEITRQLGCRANKRDEILLTTAARLDKRNRNTFIVLAATTAARKVLQAHGIEESTIYSEGVPNVRRRANRVAA
jgi:uncharacterized protein (DUF1778 family)